jgi:hypothetical protein
MIDAPDTSPFEPSAADWDAHRDRLLRELRRPGTRRRRRGPRLALAALLLAGTAAAATASSGLLRSDDVIVDAVACLRTPGQDVEQATWIPAQPDPVAACAELWERGPVAQGGAPPLVACAGRDAPVRVVPAESEAICARLGLAPLGPEYDAFARRQSEARAVVDSVMTARGNCPATAPPLFESMRNGLAAAGLADWRVVAPARPEPVGPDCRADVDARSRTVTVHHVTPESRIYSHVLGQEYGSRDETVSVTYEGRSDCPAVAPLLESVRATLAAPAGGAPPAIKRWRAVAPDGGHSCRAVVDGPTRTVTLDR